MQAHRPGRDVHGPEGLIGNDILRVSGGKFTEYWVASYTDA